MRQAKGMWGHVEQYWESSKDMLLRYLSTAWDKAGGITGTAGNTLQQTLKRLVGAATAKTQVHVVSRFTSPRSDEIGSKHISSHAVCEALVFGVQDWEVKSSIMSCVL